MLPARRFILPAAISVFLLFTAGAFGDDIRESLWAAVRNGDHGASNDRILIACDGKNFVPRDSPSPLAGTRERAGLRGDIGVVPSRQFAAAALVPARHNAP